MAEAEGAAFETVEGDALRQGFPALAAVGGGSPRAPAVGILRWEGAADGPLVALCGKGVCFDTGGLDLKPSAGMLRMKKDMGGAAVVLGLAARIIRARLPVRLLVLVGAVENSISGEAFRPMDVLRTRKGLTVEVGNTDAEGRLVLADLLAFAAEQSPAIILDCATLTGAARVALGPDLPAIFSNDDALARIVQRAGDAHHDAVWHLPLRRGYDSWLDSTIADLNNVASRPMAGAVVAALFLNRFVPAATPGCTSISMPGTMPAVPGARKVAKRRRFAPCMPESPIGSPSGKMPEAKRHEGMTVPQAASLAAPRSPVPAVAGPEPVRGCQKKRRMEKTDVIEDQRR